MAGVVVTEQAHRWVIKPSELMTGVQDWDKDRTWTLHHLVVTLEDGYRSVALFGYVDGRETIGAPRHFYARDDRIEEFIGEAYAATVDRVNDTARLAAAGSR